MARIKESELQLPALYVIYRSGKANTSQIIRELTAVFHPQGEDAQILAGRNDTKFSQIVRNLMGSHFDTNGMELYAVKDGGGDFALTPAGVARVEAKLGYLQYQFENPFSYDQAITLSQSIHEGSKKLYIYAEDDKVMEGRAETKTVVVRERSRKLRQAALAHYTVDGHIRCSACGFDFKEVYGELGDGYIQMHHEKPIFQYDSDGFEAYIAQAVQDMKPVCANCHCMLHRPKGTVLTIAELRSILAKQ